jgi:hypothetical protein
MASYVPSQAEHGRRHHKHTIALLLQPKVERIIVFTDKRCHGGNNFDEEECQWDEGPSTLRYAQFDYDGKCIFESQMSVSKVDTWQDAFFQHGHNHFTPVDDRGTFKISIVSRNPTYALRWIQFDERVNKFTQPVPTTEKGQMWALPELFWWKDTVYSSTKANEPPQSIPSFYLTYMGTRYAATKLSSAL